MSSSKSYAVVEFTKEKSVQAVPSNWISDDNSKCYWPLNSFKIAEWRKARTVPRKNGNWQLLDARVFKTYCKCIIQINHGIIN